LQIDPQIVSGVFKWGDTLEKLLDLGARDAVLAMGEEEGYGDERVWLTALAIVVLENKFGIHQLY
jgi:hypothetical protein